MVISAILEGGGCRGKVLLTSRKGIPLGVCLGTLFRQGIENLRIGGPHDGDWKDDVWDKWWVCASARTFSLFVNFVQVG